MVYAAGACSSYEDEGSVNAIGGENWEMNAQLNSNFAFGLPKDDTLFLPQGTSQDNADTSDGLSVGSSVSILSNATAVEVAA
jgi:hypothetical protein